MKVLYVEDMSCEHCVERITKSLNDLGLDFKIDLANKLIEINGCEKCVEKAQDSLSVVGYNSTLVE